MPNNLRKILGYFALLCFGPGLVGSPFPDTLTFDEVTCVIGTPLSHTAKRICAINRKLVDVDDRWQTKVMKVSGDVQLPHNHHLTKSQIAIEGCCHGELDAIYGRISELERRNNYTVDVVLICGDFQAIRNSLDLGCMSVPQKYKRLGGFHK